MIPQLNSVWNSLLLLLAVELSLVALVLAVLQRPKIPAGWRRALCQAAMVCVLLITVCELSGAGRNLANRATSSLAKNWASQKNSEAHKIVIPEVADHAESETPSVSPQLSPDFRAKVEAR